MEIIIIISVLSTLGVVAVVTAIAVAFRMLKGKVDVNDYNNTIADISLNAELEREKIVRNVDLNDNNMNDKVDQLRNDMVKYMDEVYNQINDENSDIRRFVDSRCDKLDTKIKGLEKENELVTR